MHFGYLGTSIAIVFNDRNFKLIDSLDFRNELVYDCRSNTKISYFA